jgi:L-alanine-DL-glutamate epimerase-like enolase superfamily enzyme
MSKGVSRESPVVTEMSVVPVAGHDSMLLNLGGAHGPLFTRNVVILKDNAGNTGAGESSRRRAHPSDAGGCAAAGHWSLDRDVAGFIAPCLPT